ncbi:MAG TPA: hypothetical protein VD929_10350 [Caulobacteraceae bacterium]|nr:hypothetical protein [Caulobacteraceae bacterium]
MKKLLLISLSALTLAACTTTTAYAPATSAGSTGFAEQRIESDRWRVSFRGGTDADAHRVTDLALLRAAELTLQNGYDWFWVENRYVDGPRRGYGGPSISIGGGTGSYGRHSGVSIGTGVTLPLGGGQPARAVTLEIKTGRGAKPADPNAYDARAVQQSLSARVFR